jgi:hypothetical protein
LDLDSQTGRFTTKDAWWKLVLRYLLGVVGVLVLYLIPSMLLTDAETFVSYVVRYIRYAIIGFWISGLAVDVCKAKTGFPLTITPLRK